MADIYTGIGVLKRINSLLKGKVNSPLLPIDKSKQPATVNQVKSTPGPEKIITPQVKINNDIHITGVKDKKINELICQRLTCEKAIRLKQEIKNFSSVWLSHLS
jgi:RAB protein geranylgeranyltransferase component A